MFVTCANDNADCSLDYRVSLNEGACGASACPHSRKATKRSRGTMPYRKINRVAAVFGLLNKSQLLSVKGLAIVCIAFAGRMRLYKKKRGRMFGLN